MPKNVVFIGIDDTDSKTSKGTGFLSRELSKQIEINNLGKVLNITRHQLCLSKDIKFTNRNNSACIEVSSCNQEELISYCKNFIVKNSEKNAHPAIIFAKLESVSTDVIEFAARAKENVVTIKEALSLIKKSEFISDFVEQNNTGVIGALAAIGLRATGNDGRVIWAKGHESIGMKGTFMAGEVYCETHVDTIKTLDGYKIPSNATIEFENKLIKPVLEGNNVTLIVEEINNEKLDNFICTSFKASIN
jgi:tRNA(Ile2) C34 agmatinyltransferase TiaS